MGLLEYKTLATSLLKRLLESLELGGRLAKLEVLLPPLSLEVDCLKRCLAVRVIAVN